MSVVVFARITPKADALKKAEEILQAMIQPTRAEPGNLRYELYRNDDTPVSFCLFEAYKDHAAQEAHRASEHYQTYRAHIAEHLAQPIDVQNLTTLDSAAFG